MSYLLENDKSIPTDDNIHCIRCGFTPKQKDEEYSLAKVIFVFPVPKLQPIFNNICPQCAVVILDELAPPEIRNKKEHDHRGHEHQKQDNRSYIG